MRLATAASIACVLQIIFTAAAADAATLRTAPLPADTTSGFARCAITNASSSKGTASATLYDYSSEPLQTITSFNIPPHATTVTDTVGLVDKAVGHCECTVPNATTWRCTVIWTSSDRSFGTSTP
jgi:hypothetical protein